MSTLNVSLLRKVLQTLSDSDKPIPSHLLAVQLGVHPSTIRSLLQKSKELLGVEIDAGIKGYTGVSAWGALRESVFLTEG